MTFPSHILSVETDYCLKEVQCECKYGIFCIIEFTIAVSNSSTTTQTITIKEFRRVLSPLRSLRNIEHQSFVLGRSNTDDWFLTFQTFNLVLTSLNTPLLRLTAVDRSGASG